MWAKKYRGWLLGLAPSLWPFIWKAIKWALQDYGYIQLGQNAVEKRGPLLSGVWWMLNSLWFGPCVTLVCVCIFVALEIQDRRRTAHPDGSAQNGEDAQAADFLKGSSELGALDHGVYTPVSLEAIQALLREAIPQLTTIIETLTVNTPQTLPS